jgi:hypothetical protein
MFDRSPGHAIAPVTPPSLHEPISHNTVALRGATITRDRIDSRSCEHTDSDRATLHPETLDFFDEPRWQAPARLQPRSLAALDHCSGDVHAAERCASDC